MTEYSPPRDPLTMLDVMERRLVELLNRYEIEYTSKGNTPLGFGYYIPKYNVYLETKKNYTPKTLETLSAGENIILIQGLSGIHFLAQFLQAAEWKHSRQKMVERISRKKKY